MSARTGRILALLGILLVAANLRTAVAALSPIVHEIAVDIPLGSIAVGVLGMLPPVCFAIFGVIAPVFTRRFGLERVLVVAMVAVVAGHLVRAASGSLPLLFVASAVTFAGMGVGNVALPPLVKKYFPDRIGLVTSLYVTVMSVSTLIPPLVAVPVAEGFGWRVALGMWGVVSVLAVLPWIGLVVRERRARAERAARADPLIEEPAPAVLGRLWRSSIAWALAVIFAVSSLNAYAMFAWLPQMLSQIAGASPGTAGALLSVFAGMGIPAGVLVPILAARMRNVALLVYLGVAFFVVGYLGLLTVPGTATWLWVAFIGLGPLLFPLALVLINVRTRSHEGSVALSGFVQGVGYTLGALGPLAVGVLHELTGQWTLAIVFLLVTALAGIFAGAIVARPRMLEDDLER
ncbi:MFS transporter [Compostimonas suwonensis]|uniref:CP family cyanate transporter-like MFS transporter n=1 Tax=Compostimonas suwonensis TaxID=1048394 RepID=A0A2M9BUA6_9MICO|nr:MFS transporter [Compostimonas suwonensis]PJJ61511.1 CP family cyanate transporter-like MFS transporter [Compostimonas suwonensis]